LSDLWSGSAGQRQSEYRLVIRLSQPNAQTYADVVSDPQIEIITPSPQDADALATVLYRASAAAYTGIFPPGVLWTLEQTVASCRAHFSDPTAIVLAAVSGDPPAREWLGVAVVLVPGARLGDAELRRMYVLPERWGQGVGSRLLDAVLRRAQRAGATTAWLSVLEKNDRARTFYEHRGWRPADDEGTHAHDGVVEVRYQYALARAETGAPRVVGSIIDPAGAGATS
jgi:GNAT superfamily N-acetyltransferase